MANITAADVNKLRKATGAGMMDCKNALVETDGDFEKAIDYLRKKGQKVANKRSDRETNEGIVIAKTSDSQNFGIVVMLNCETDFVAKNQEFTDIAKAISEVALDKKPNTIEELKALSFNNRTVAEHISDYMGKTGEKIELGDYQFVNAPKVSIYNHNGDKLSAIVGFNKNNVNEIDILGKDVVMQIAAMNPIALDKDNVAPEIIEHEMEIGKEQARQEGKPEDMLEKIAMGKLNKFFKENTLLNQEFIKDNKKTVSQYLSDHDKELKIVDFKRVSVR
ncbi:MAG: translation elongation factor Ts [Bacteroidales bacterium]|jgi:elongation factor Ts|nr:translation elongation factor Ts [Bacteroidales bacterium]MDD4213763.1 translation elongation factor Ts [Bacteroidales bacterium]